MTLDYRTKIIQALALAKNLDQVAFIESKVTTTNQLNRRTLVGRKLTEELLTLCRTRANELIKNGAQPF